MSTIFNHWENSRGAVPGHPWLCGGSGMWFHERSQLERAHSLLNCSPLTYPRIEIFPDWRTSPKSLQIEQGDDQQIQVGWEVHLKPIPHDLEESQWKWSQRRAHSKIIQKSFTSHSFIYFPFKKHFHFFFCFSKVIQKWFTETDSMLSFMTLSLLITCMCRLPYKVMRFRVSSAWSISICREDETFQHE